jgi:hypothetical protein
LDWIWKAASKDLQNKQKIIKTMNFHTGQTIALDGAEPPWNLFVIREVYEKEQTIRCEFFGGPLDGEEAYFCMDRFKP